MFCFINGTVVKLMSVSDAVVQTLALLNNVRTLNVERASFIKSFLLSNI